MRGKVQYNTEERYFRYVQCKDISGERKTYIANFNLYDNGLGFDGLKLQYISDTGRNTPNIELVAFPKKDGYKIIDNFGNIRIKNNTVRIKGTLENDRYTLSSEAEIENKNSERILDASAKLEDPDPLHSNKPGRNYTFTNIEIEDSGELFKRVS